MLGTDVRQENTLVRDRPVGAKVRGKDPYALRCIQVAVKAVKIPFTVMLCEIVIFETRLVFSITISIKLKGE